MNVLRKNAWLIYIFSMGLAVLEDKGKFHIKGL